jgi:hypothetical protein
MRQLIAAGAFSMSTRVLDGGDQIKEGLRAPIAAGSNLRLTDRTGKLPSRSPAGEPTVYVEGHLRDGKRLEPVIAYISVVNGVHAFLRRRHLLPRWGLPAATRGYPL